MVHGGGSCSGGGYSGGGFSGGTYMSTNTYYRNGRRNDSEGCLKCIVCVCRCIGICVCCKGQSHVGQILIFWAWLVVLFLITGLSVGLGRFGPTDTAVSPSDMIMMKRGIDPTFCGSVSVRTTLPVNTYLLPKAPQIASDRVNYSFNKTTSISDDRYEYWGFYLIAGSDITVLTCADSFGDFYIVKGKHQFGQWKNDNYDSANNERHILIGGCSYPFYSRTRVSYHISTTDEYYFVFANHGSSSIGLDLTFNLTRTIYDLGGNESLLCVSATSCTVDLSSSDSKQTIVVYVPPFDEFDFDVTTACSALIYVYILIFFLIPFTIGSIFTVVVLHRKRRTTSTPVNERREHHAFSTNTSPPQYQTMPRESEREHKLTTPSYGFQDDGMAVQPPSYEEAVARKDGM
ncbi:uncharacterized protein LOC117342453 [Pecten maximus]|uniref:uncharacterized protein LOC117342453 n=1 Tax=Pecten maximus TaxID=6579 RepID=UPI001458FD7D|nr:uncharacterized protein LOC117342453 [Pecten maximus]